MNDYRQKIEQIIEGFKDLPVTEEMRQKEAATREIQRQILAGERPAPPDEDPFAVHWWWPKIPQWHHLQ